MQEQYGVVFNNCDGCIQIFNGKIGRSFFRVDTKNDSDYLFTCILINAYHFWINDSHVGEDMKEVKWNDICLKLDLEMISEKIRLGIHLTICLFCNTLFSTRVEFKTK